MSPKEELIQAIEQSPDELVRALLELLRMMQRQQSSEVLPPHSPEADLDKPGYDFFDLAGRLTWRDDTVMVQRTLEMSGSRYVLATNAIVALRAMLN